MEKIALNRKRKAENSPIKNDRAKRCALGNLTNARTNALVATDSDENLKKAGQAVTKKDDGAKRALRNVNTEGIQVKGVIQPISSRTRAAAKVQTKPPATKTRTKGLGDLLPPPQKPQNSENQPKSKSNEVSVITTAVKSKQSTEAPLKTSRRISNDFEKTDDSLYTTAVEDISTDVSRTSSDVQRSHSSKLEVSEYSDAEKTLSQASADVAMLHVDDDLNRVPTGVEDFDKENWNDPYQVSNYAQNIFNYLKQREHNYKIKDYMGEQPELSKWMRSLLVDWMVEVQESFELNHETLYLAVKIVDSYLGKEKVSKDALQLLGAASLLIACKYDVSSFLPRQSRINFDSISFG